MVEITKHGTEITIETLSVTTIKKRDNVPPTAYCANCGHAVTYFDPKYGEPVTEDNPKRLVTAGHKVGGPS